MNGGAGSQVNKSDATSKNANDTISNADAGATIKSGKAASSLINLPTRNSADPNEVAPENAKMRRGTTKGSRAASKSHGRTDVFSGMIGSLSATSEQAGKIPRFCSTVKVYEKFCDMTGLPIDQHKVYQFRRNDHKRTRTQTFFSGTHED